MKHANFFLRHPGVCRGPAHPISVWIPAFAGMTEGCPKVSSLIKPAVVDLSTSATVHSYILNNFILLCVSFASGKADT